MLALACALAAMLLLPGQMLLAAYAAFTLLLLRCGLDQRGRRRHDARRAATETGRA